MITIHKLKCDESELQKEKLGNMRKIREDVFKVVM